VQEEVASEALRDGNSSQEAIRTSRIRHHGTQQGLSIFATQDGGLRVVVKAERGLGGQGLPGGTGRALCGGGGNGASPGLQEPAAHIATPCAGILGPQVDGPVSVTLLQKRRHFIVVHQLVLLRNTQRIGTFRRQLQTFVVLLLNI